MKNSNREMLVAANDDLPVGSLQQIAIHVLEIRRFRSCEFGSEFFTPSWDIILTLAASARSEPVSLNAIAHELSYSETTMRRWLNALVGKGHVKETGSDSYTLSASAIASLTRIAFSTR